MSDHKAEAEAIIAPALASGTFDQTRDYIALAQVHATLYLAEQQRIANQVAFLAICETRGAADDAYRTLDVRVREALGLS